LHYFLKSANKSRLPDEDPKLRVQNPADSWLPKNGVFGNFGCPEFKPTHYQLLPLPVLFSKKPCQAPKPPNPLPHYNIRMSHELPSTRYTGL
jgi:hypothetical protein